MRKFIIDCDTAEDDVFSIYMLLRNGVELLGITVVGGNVDYNIELDNTLWALEFVGREDIPVFPGADRPLVKPFRSVPEVHGKGGLGKIEARPKRLRASTKHAMDAIIEASENFPGELEILAISPLTNLALALIKDRRLKERVKRVYVMGGTIYGRGNITPIAEYNIWVDPDAAKVVFSSGIPMTIVAWDLCTQYLVDGALWLKINSMGTKLSKLYIDMYSHYRDYALRVQNLKGHPHPDVLTTAVALDQSLITEGRNQFVDVENSEGLTRGATVIDHGGVDPFLWGKRDPNASVVYGVDSNKFFKMLIDLLSWF
jgi:purine nucleosidase